MGGMGKPTHLSGPRRSGPAAANRPGGVASADGPARVGGSAMAPRPKRTLGSPTGGLGRSSMVWTVEGFEPLAEVGRGSTGVVLRARETVTGAVVAVRRLALDLCDSPAFL